MDLDGWRRRIDALNAELVRLLNERAKCALEIADLKRRSGLPVQDPAREAEVLKMVAQRNGGPLTEEALKKIFVRIMTEHRKLERKLKSGGAR